MALKKPSDLFESKNNEDIIISEQVEKLSEEIEKGQGSFQEGIEANIVSSLETIDENLKNLQSQIYQLSSAKLKGVKGDISKLTEIVENLIDVQIPKYRKDVYTAELKINKRFSNLQEDLIEKIEENANDIRKKIKSFYDDDIASLKENTDNLTKGLEVVEKYITNHSKDIVNLREEIFNELSKSNINVPGIENKVSQITKAYSKLNEGLLNEPPNVKNSDPLTSLDQNFVTLEQLSEHYRLFINRIQQQLATIGGGGETRLKYLDDVVGIATNASEYDGKFLKYNHTSGNFEFDTVSQNESYWVSTAVGIHTLSNVGIGTTNPLTVLEIDGQFGFSGSNIKIGNENTGANTLSDLDNNDGVYNIFLGSSSGRDTDYGNYNLCLGLNSSIFNQSGYYNIYLGSFTGVSTASSYKIIFGQGTRRNYFDAPIPDKDKQLAIGVNTTGVSEYWIIGDENMNIGLGVQSPTVKLDVDGDINFSGILYQNGVPFTSGGESYWDSTVVGIHTLSNVGIGTINPTSKLTVDGDVKVSGIVTASSFAPSSGFIKSADGTNSFYIYDGTGNVAFQGTIGVNQINSGGGYKALEFSATTTPDILVSNNSIVSGFSSATDTRLNSTSEKSTIVDGNTVNLVYNMGGGNIAICTNPSGSITLDVTGIPTDSTFNNRVLTFSVFVNQDATGYACTSITLNGVPTTIKYPGGIVSVGSTSAYDVFNITCINPIGSASTTANYIAFGMINGNFK